MELNKNIEDNQCSVLLKVKGDEVCSDDKTLGGIKEVLKQNNIVVNTKDKKDIIEKAKGITNCKDELCVLNDNKIINAVGESHVGDVIEKFFSKKGPRNTTEWLSNNDIDDVLKEVNDTLKRFGDSKKNFYHIPFQMIDFDKTGGELSDFDVVKEYKKGMRTFGVVINTDNSRGGGIHWFCLYGDLTKNPATLEYFNSSGTRPMAPVAVWLENTKHKIEKGLNIPTKIIKHRVVHQTDGHSCGPYSLYYILSRVSGHPYTKFNKRITDDEMLKFRKYLFR